MQITHQSKYMCCIAQVIHHPTVIAAHSEGEHWTFSGDAEVRSKFWGRSIELIPVGLIRLRFDDGDEYSWQKVGCLVFTQRLAVSLSFPCVASGPAWVTLSQSGL